MGLEIVVQVEGRTGRVDNQNLSHCVKAVVDRILGFIQALEETEKSRLLYVVLKEGSWGPGECDADKSPRLQGVFLYRR